MQDRRKADRRGVHKPALVSHRGAPAKLKCIIIDLNATGAHLRFPFPTEVPDTLTLSIPGDNLVLEVSVSWRDHLECGVQFKRRIAHPLLTIRRMQHAAENALYA